MPIEGRCASCGAATGPGSNFCPRCGHPVGLGSGYGLWARAARIVLTIALVLLSLAGAIFSSALVAKHTRTLAPDSVFAKMCGESADQASGCDLVLTNRWSVLPIAAKGQPAAKQGIPVAAVGMWYFLVLSAWFFLVGIPTYPRRIWIWFPLTLTGVGAAVSGFYTYVMKTEIGTYCVLCMAVHVINGLLLLLVLISIPRKPKTGRTAPITAPAAGTVAVLSMVGARPAGTPSAPLPALPTHWQAVSAIAVGFVLALLAHRAMLFGAAASQCRSQFNRLKEEYDVFAQDLDFLWESYAKQESKKDLLAPRPDESFRGPETARTTLVVFSDFQCDHCKEFEDRFRDTLFGKFDKSLKVMFRHYPMCTLCNKNIPSNLHPLACEAAKCAEAARLQGGGDGFWKMHDLLFARQTEFAQRPWAALAEQAGLDPERLEADMRKPEVVQRVQDDIALGKEAGIRGTPFVLIDGRALRASMNENDKFWDRLAQAVNAKQAAMDARNPPPEAPPSAEEEQATANMTSEQRGQYLEAKRLFGAWSMHPRVKVNVEGDDRYRGSAEGIIVMMIYGDLQSPQCLEFQRRFDSEYAGFFGSALKVYFRHFPLDAECNGNLPATAHPQACAAARAVEAARAQGGAAAFWKMHDLIYERQDDLATISWPALADQAGLDRARFETDMAGEPVESTIVDDINAGIRIGVDTAPYVILNNRRVPAEAMSSEPFWQAMGATAQEAQKKLGPAGPQ